MSSSQKFDCCLNVILSPMLISYKTKKVPLNSNTTHDKRRSSLFHTSIIYFWAPKPPMYIANAVGLRVCIKTDPGPWNLQTRPSPVKWFEMMPPLETRSILYSQLQATKWPLSMMYCSPGPSCTIHKSQVHGSRDSELTSFLIIAPKLAIQAVPF